MKILVVGAGAVGGYFGALLAASGNDVYLVARGKHLEAIQREGLHVESMQGTFTLKLPATANPAELEIVPDLIIFAVKSFDTQNTIKQIEHLVGPRTQILGLQNGVENYDILVSKFGANRVIRAFCRVGSEILAPGKIRQTAFGLIQYGEEDGSRSERIVRLDETLSSASIKSIVSADIRRDVWLKFSWNSLFNVLTGLLSTTIIHLYNDETLKLMHRMGAEIISIATAEGINLTIDDIKNTINKAKELGEFRTSTYQDRDKGKRLEYDAFTGAIVRFGIKHNLQTPEYCSLHALYKAIQTDS
jgi:2-dehydropantoate 2-reductase